MPMAVRNIVAAVLLLLFCAFYAWQALELPDRSIPNTPGPAFFPLVIVVALAGLSLALLVQGISALRAKMAGAEGSVTPRQTVASVVLFVVYLGAMPFTGFLLASIPFFAGQMILYGARNPISVIGWSLAVPIALFFVFTRVFQILLPSGPLGF